MASETTGAHALVRALEAAGVERIFALPGEENIDVMAAIRSSSIEPIVCRHEQHAAFMAATHGRLTGQPGVCLATLGPGATNLATGLAHATLGRFPMIAITGQKPLTDNPEGSFQKLNVTAAVEPVTVATSTATHPAEIPALVSRAWIDALRAPGAVVIEIPEDVAAADFELSSEIAAPAVPVAKKPCDLASTVRLIEEADFPIVLAGSGSAQPEAAAALGRFATQTGLGVVTTQMGAGAVPAAHPQRLGALGIHADDWIHLAFDVADLVIAVGYHPTEHPPSNWWDGHRLIEIADSASADERWYRPDQRIEASIPETLDQLATELGHRTDDRVAKVAEVVAEGLASEHVSGDGIDAIGLVDAFGDTLADDSIVAMDNTVTKIWFARRYPVRAPWGLLVDNALATMGAGLAIGTVAAQLHPERRTVVVAGDGGFLMNVQDLSTAVAAGIDLDVVILVDDHYGFIRWEQEEQGRVPYGVRLHNPDFTKLADAFGATSVSVETNAELRAALATPERGVRLIIVEMDQRANALLGGDQRTRARERYGSL